HRLLAALPARHHRPARGVAAARVTPSPRHAEPARDRPRRPPERIEAAREDGVGPAREVLLLHLAREVAEPPVVRHPERAAPGTRPAAAAQLPGDLVHGVEVDAVSAVPRG